MDKALTNEKTAEAMKANTLMIKSTDKEFIYDLMAKVTLVAGKMEISTE